MLVDGQPDECQVDSPLAHGFHQGPGPAFFQGQFHLRIQAAVAVQGVGHFAPERRRFGETDTQPPDHALGRLLAAQVGAPDLFENRASLDQVDPARLGQAHPARLPVEKRDPEFFLEYLDLEGERRLRNADALCRPGEMQFLGNGDEIAKVTKIHIFKV